eukprot:PhM_4_TR13685/c0_g1_i1/m.75351
MADFSMRLSGLYSTLATTSTHACVANRFSLTVVDYTHRTVRTCTLKKDMNAANTAIACPQGSCTRVMLGSQAGDIVLINTEFDQLTVLPPTHTTSVLDAHWPGSSGSGIGIAATVSSDKFAVWDATEFNTRSTVGVSSTCVSCHPLDDRLIATGHEYRSLVWDARSMQKVAEIHAHLCTVQDVSWSTHKSNNWLMTCDRRGVVKVHDLRNSSSAVWTAAYDGCRTFFSPLQDIVVVHQTRTGDVRLLQGAGSSPAGEEPRVLWRRPTGPHGVVRQVGCSATSTSLNVVTLDDTHVRRYEAVTLSNTSRAGSTESISHGSLPSTSRSMFDLLTLIKNEMKELRSHDSIRVVCERPEKDETLMIVMRLLLGVHSFNALLEPNATVSVTVTASITVEYPSVLPRWRIGPCDLVAPNHYTLCNSIIERLNHPNVLRSEAMCGLSPGMQHLLTFLNLQEMDVSSFVPVTEGVTSENQVSSTFVIPKEIPKSEHTPLCISHRPARCLILPVGLLVTVNASTKHSHHPQHSDSESELGNSTSSSAAAPQTPHHQLSVIPVESAKVAVHSECSASLPPMNASYAAVWKAFETVLRAGPSHPLRAVFAFSFRRHLVEFHSPVDAALCTVAALRAWLRKVDEEKKRTKAVAVAGACTSAAASAAAPGLRSVPFPVPSELLLYCLCSLRVLHDRYMCVDDVLQAHEITRLMYSACLWGINTHMNTPSVVTMLREGFRDILSDSQADSSDCRMLCSADTVCAICQMRVKGLIHICRLCGHGGHREHLLEWFQTESECPAACGCLCALNYGL